MGYINNPKKAIYNKVYNKTTFSTNPVSKSSGCLGSFLLILIIPIAIIISLIALLV